SMCTRHCQKNLPQLCFKNIKHGLFRHENLPVRVDCFIARHLSFIEGNMLICSAKEQTKDEATVGSLEVTDANSGSMTTHSAEDKIKMDAHLFVGSDAATNIPPADEDAAENWRGLAVPPKKRKRTSYLSPCTEWLHADESFWAKRVKVGLLKNGNLHQPIRLEESTISVLSTCAFDAFFSVLMLCLL
uniref:Uncharacterized protein n=1 Tax=Haplochromis burtoni TaxID=8153 RepID=A0A3Q2VRM4_HAPBU